jgi:hypothetical protein
MNGSSISFVKIYHAQVPASSYHELSSSLSNCLVYRISDIVWLISFLRKFFYSSYHDLESYRINILDLIQFINEGFAFVLARS